MLIEFCDEMLPRKDHLWAFPDAEGIRPTNNAAERARRSTVILRKLSFETQSSRSSRYLEPILSVSETCRLQKRNACEYLIRVMKANFSGETAPTPLPLIEDHAATTSFFAPASERLPLCRINLAKSSFRAIILPLERL